MAENYNITSADAEVVLTVEELYPAGVKLQQFSTDAAAVAEAVQIAETRMGVDGIPAFGYTPSMKTVTINLEANSSSAVVFDRIYEAEESNKKPYVCTLTVKMPAIGKTYKFSKGTLQTYGGMPGMNKVLGPQAHILHFGKLEIN